MDKMNVQTDYIGSRSNASVAEAAALRHKKERCKSGLTVFDGIKLCSEYLSTGHTPKRIFVREDKTALLSGLLAGLSSENRSRLCLSVVPAHVFERLTDESAPDGIVTVAEIKDFPLTFLPDGVSVSGDGLTGQTMLLSSLRDPGNVGTILRTALAFGFHRLILSADCADVLNPKTIRASMGAVFKLPVVVCENPTDQISAYRKSGRRVFCAELRPGSLSVADAHIGPDDIIVIGNEGHGISPDISGACNGSVYLPISAEAESLNASVAASIFLFMQSKLSL